MLKKLENDSEKASAVIKRRTGLEDSKVKITLVAPTLEIELPEESFLAEGLQVIKRAIANDVFKFLPSVRAVRFVENYTAPAEQKKEQPKAEATPEAQR